MAQLVPRKTVPGKGGVGYTVSNDRLAVVVVFDAFISLSALLLTLVLVGEIAGRY
jgi:hypothetical protein